jgi:phosphoglycerol transferase MdoB-like AlkP superfamily enzyme
VKPTLFLRIASVLTMIHCILHTIGGVLSSPKHGSEELAVVETMKAHTFNVMGSMRSYWDFFFGYGLGLTITLLIQSLLFWQVATMSKTNAAWTRPIVLLFFFNFVVMSVVVWRYFFIAPAITELLIAACLAAAYFTATAPA